MNATPEMRWRSPVPERRTRLYNCQSATAVCLWRKARVIRAENGEIRKRLDTAALDPPLRNSSKVNLELALSAMDLQLFRGDGSGPKIALRDRWALVQVSQINLMDHPSGLVYLLSLLEIAKSEIVKDGCISEKTREQVFCSFCFVDYLFAITCFNSASQESIMKDPTSGAAVLTLNEKCRADLGVFIDDWIRQLRALIEHAKSRELNAVDAESRSFCLPPADAADKILRYETHLDRQLYRAMDQLERLQRQRKGENIPPPINLN
jgi:hypothetical protein